MRFSKGKVEVLSPRVKHPCSSPGWGTALQEWPTLGHSRQLCALAARTARLPQVWIGMQPLGCGKGFVFHSSILVRLHLGTASSFECTNARKSLINWSECSIVLMLTGVSSTCPVSRDWRNWACLAGNRHSPRGQPKAPQYLWGG